MEWFKAHCTLNASMETNKAELKEKIAEAKTTGERAINSRFIFLMRFQFMNRIFDQCTFLFQVRDNLPETVA